MKKMRNKYLYFVFAFLMGIIVGGKVVSDVCEELLNEKEKAIYKFKGYFSIQSVWFMKRIQGKSMADWFVKHKEKSIAIYGMGDLGKLLIYSLRGTEVNVKTLMDANKAHIEDFGIELVGPEETLNPEIDAVVVTVTHAFNEIKNTLSVKNTDLPILSLEDIIYDL